MTYKDKYQMAEESEVALATEWNPSYDADIRELLAVERVPERFRLNYGYFLRRIRGDFWEVVNRDYTRVDLFRGMTAEPRLLRLTDSVVFEVCKRDHPYSSDTPGRDAAILYRGYGHEPWRNREDWDEYIHRMGRLRDHAVRLDEDLGA